MPQSRTTAEQAARDGSWMQPEAKNQDLLYVSDSNPANRVTVYSYTSHKLVGTLTGFSYPAGLCTDSAGNVFVANEDGNDILEYPHGGTKPIESLPDSDGAIACSIDSTTGNLAVANAGYVTGCSGSIYVYQNASGTPTKYTDGSNICNFMSCVYDGGGNLFVTGSNASYGVAFAELRKGSGDFINIGLSPKLAHGFGLGWDGRHVTLWSGGAPRNLMYRLTIKGGRARSRHFTWLEGGIPNNDYWFQSYRRRQVLIGADNFRGNDVLYWNYPAGGYPIVVINHGIDDPVGVTVSVAR